MKQTFSRLLVVLAALLSLAVLAACGGGGGGGGVETIEYTGVTTQAPITNSNAEEVATDAYLGGATGSEMGGVFGAIGSGGQAAKPRHMAFAERLVGTVQNLDLSAGAPAVGQTVSMTEPCDSGSISVTMSVNETTGAFSGSFSYNNCTFGSETMSGSVTFSGNVDMSDPDNPVFNSLTMTFNAVTVSGGGSSIAFGGTMSATMSGSTVTMTMDMRIRENGTGVIVWVNNYTMNLEENLWDSVQGMYYTQVTVSGRFYDPIHGFVDVTTVAPLRVYDFYEYPSQGELRFDGQGATYARLVVPPPSVSAPQIPPTECQVFGDSDPFTPGEEFDSGVILWADL